MALTGFAGVDDTENEVPTVQVSLMQNANVRGRLVAIAARLQGKLADSESAVESVVMDQSIGIRNGES